MRLRNCGWAGDENVEGEMTTEELQELEKTLNRGKELMTNLAHLKDMKELYRSQAVRVYSDGCCGNGYLIFQSDYLGKRMAEIVAHEIQLIEAELSALTIPKPFISIASEAHEISEQTMQTLCT